MGSKSISGTEGVNTERPHLKKLTLQRLLNLHLPMYYIQQGCAYEQRDLCLQPEERRKGVGKYRDVDGKLMQGSV